jgi:pSer/pThr/pTyr-binding forkhead associated (FHA) protein
LAPHSLLEVLKYFLLALLWLFFIYAIRMVWVEIRRSRPEQAAVSEAPPVAADRSVPLRLKVVDPPQRRGRMFELGQEVTLGRSPGCAVYLEDDTFTSSVHARVYRRNGELWLEDLRSTNGTFLNDSKVSEPTRIQRGDRIKVGSTILEVAR